MIDPFVEHLVVTVITTLSTVVPVSVGFVWAIKSDTKVLKERLDSVDNRLEKLDGVLVAMANADGRANVQDERTLAQGKRLDEIATRVNKLSDTIIQYLRDKRSHIQMPEP